MNLIKSVPRADATETVAVRLRVNGTNYGLRLDPRTSLLNLLREKLDLPGTKKDCDHGQCGYCTSGQICSAVAMIQEVDQGAASHVTPDVRKGGNVVLTDDEIRERMSGNICRCGAYPGIVAAIREVTQQSSQRGV